MTVGSNIWKLFALKILRGNMLFMPTIVLFFQENGLSMFEVFLLQTFFGVAIFTLEIPSGYFADRFGRRNAILIGAIATFVSFVIYSFAFDFWTMLVAEMLLGFGFAFTSGADSALLYDSLKATESHSSYRRVEGRLQGMYTLSEAIGSVLGGYLALLSLRAPLIAQAIIDVFPILIALSLYEINRHGGATEVRSWSMRQIVVDTLHTNVYLRWLITFYAVTTTAGLVMVWFRQSYFELLQLPLYMYGYVWAALMMVVSVGNLLSDKMAHTFGERRVLVLIVALGVFAFALLNLPPTVWVLSALVLLALMRGLLDPVASAMIQREARSEIRATVLSVRSFAARALFSIVGPFIGWAADMYSLAFAFAATGILFTVFASVFLALLLFAAHRGGYGSHAMAKQ